MVNKGIPFFRGTEIGELAEGKDISPELFITEEHYRNLKEISGVPKIGDLLMPSICPDGRIWIVKEDSPFYFKDGRVLWINFKDNSVNPVYIQYALKIKLINNYLKIASGTTFAELKIFSLKNIELIIPPVELQNAFAERVLVINNENEKMKKSLLWMEDLYNSLLQKAFKGELFPE
ncbi:restriction endonuclease subunit S [Paenibacillus sp. UKAQ_18]|nr:restriction endonuclease subunit S [Paenibacillus sp. UKAQ_18]